jgi:hypothetical protein
LGGEQFGYNAVAISLKVAAEYRCKFRTAGAVERRHCSCCLMVRDDRRHDRRSDAPPDPLVGLMRVRLDRSRAWCLAASDDA